MSIENNSEPSAVVQAVDAEAKTPGINGERSLRGQSTASKVVRPTAIPSRFPGAKAKRSTEQERVDKLRLIATQVAEGKSTLKAAIKSAGISEQTYYNWKRSAGSLSNRNDRDVQVNHELADLVKLEAENHRLRKILAERLRGENAELRKRLGLD